MAERVQLAFMLLSQGQLGEASLRIGFETRPLDRGLLHRLKLDLAHLRLEVPALPRVLLRLHPRLLLLLPPADAFDTSLLFIDRPLFG
jgi:hypothetical protein